MTDKQVRERLLSLLYAAWQKSGKHHRLYLDDLYRAFNAENSEEQMMVLRNLQLLCDLGLAKWASLRSVQLTCWGVLECEQKGIAPEPLTAEQSLKEVKD